MQRDVGDSASRVGGSKKGSREQACPIYHQSGTGSPLCTQQAILTVERLQNTYFILPVLEVLKRR